MDSYEEASTFILWYGIMVNMMISMNDKQTNIADNNQVGILVKEKPTSIYVND